MGGAQPHINRLKRLVEFKNQNGLHDLQTYGNEFTWRKRKFGPNNTLEKLDRVLVSHQILQWFPHILTKYHAFTSSDHCQISVNLNNNNLRKVQPFKFEMM